MLNLINRNLVLIALSLIFLCSCTMVRVDLGPRQAPFEEKTIKGKGPGKVLQINLSGVIMMTPQRGGASPWSYRESMVANLTEQLELAAEDDDVKAVVIQIDSPGGSVTASDVIHHQISEYKKKTGNKVVASLMGTATSGGYYVALSSDHISALPTTVTGSIGVISLKLNFAGLLDKFGVQAVAVKSAPYKDMWSPFRPAEPEERRIMQNMIDQMFARFKTVLKEGRPNLTDAQAKKAANAQIFTAAEALELGLIDEIGYPEQAFAKAKELAGLKEAKLIRYQRPGAYKPNIYSQYEDADVLIDPREMMQIVSPQLMYLWLPGLQN